MKMTNGIMGNRAKTIIVTTLVLCFGLDFVKGGCISYGHSCWGGHGKRSGPPGQYSTRALPVPLAPPPELWTRELFAISNNGYYPPLARMLQFPPAAVIKMLGSDSTAAVHGSDGESATEVTDDDEQNTIARNSNNNYQPAQQRRKTAALENESARANIFAEEDFGELLLQAPTANRGSNLLKLLSPTSFRKHNQSA
ncbi:uncharacterized protein LOC129761940 isoform X2 [Toxorhynchites rutilus septentrionalis]|uniref:uncharacterized protein LOC129761940 isoform X2 n=1 Tax=Toxorhynchites rutilus septentrionalis TaxID=329112 RepID=UPI002479F0A2|nr:uncharacterized protein LOC129761940 isoform X2 [Toxorhynchites rutilus septentrionalis]